MNMETMIVLWLTAAVVLAILDQWRRGGFGHGLEYAYAGLEGCDLKQDQKQQPEWMNLATFKKGGGSAPAPDPAIGEAALKNAELGEDWLVFAREQFDVANKRQAEQDKIANQVTQQQLASSKQASEWATQDRKRWENTFRPLQDQFIDTAKNWDSTERQASQAAAARADVQNNATLARQAGERNMAAMGVDPRSGRYAGVNRAGEISTGLAAAGAENNARNAVRKEGLAMRAEAINLGNGLAVNPATSMGLASSTGSAAYGTTAANNGQAAGNASIMGQGYQGAMSGYNSQASILNSQYQNQLSAWNAQQQANASSSSSLWGGLGSVAGMALMASSKEYKEDKEPVDGALEAIENMPIEKWKYKDGIADEGEHIGPYAEDFQQQTGLGNGKGINVVDGIGLTMKAVQELNEKVEDLAEGMQSGQKGVGLGRKSKGSGQNRGMGLSQSTQGEDQELYS